MFVGAVRTAADKDVTRARCRSSLPQSCELRAHAPTPDPPTHHTHHTRWCEALVWIFVLPHVPYLSATVAHCP